MKNLVIIITAYKTHHTLRRCLNSILKEINSLKKMGVCCQIVLGIDGCSKTLKLVKKLKYHRRDNIDVYYSDNNVGTYVMKNSLINKVEDQNCFIHFFDADDFIPRGCLRKYYLACESANKLYPDNFILRAMQLKINDDVIEVRDKGCWGQKILLKLLQYKYFSFFMPCIACVMFFIDIIKNIKNLCYDKYVPNFKPRVSYGVFFTTYNCIKKMGCFHRYRVDQDNDILSRAKLLNIELKVEPLLPFLLEEYHRHL